MNKYLTSALKLSTLSLALMAAGCTGGSNSDESMRVVDGTAAKGLMKGARVRVFSLDASGNQSTTSLAGSTTATDGTFSMSVPSSTLNFVLLVDAAPGATMADEATGKDIAVPADMSMRSVVTLAAGAGAYSGAVTPLTELVAKTAEKTGGFSSANIAKAKQGAREAFGFDPELVKPVNANSDAAANATEEQKIQGLLLAAISKLAKDGALGCAAADIKCIVVSFANSGSFSGSKLVLGTTGEIYQNAIDAVVADPVINRTGRKNVVGMPDFRDQSGSTRTVIDTAIEAAKQLFASLRTSINILTNSGDSLEVRADLVKAALEKTVAPLDMNLIDWVDVASDAIDHLEDYKASAASVSATRPTLNGGSCVITQESGSPATDAATAQKTTCTFTFKYLVGKHLVHSLVIRSPSAGTYTYASQQTLVPDAGATTVVGTTADGTITYAAHGTTFTSSGKMPARTDGAGVKLSDYETWNISSTRTADTSTTASNAFKYAFSGTMTSTLGTTAVANVVINAASATDPGSYARIVQLVPGKVHGRDMKELSLSITSVSGSTTFTGSLLLNNWMADKSNVNYVASKGTFTGNLVEAGSPFFSGSLVYEHTGYTNFDSRAAVSASNFLAQTVGLSGKVALPQRPDLKLSAGVMRTALGNAVVTGQYDDGTSVVNFTVNRNESSGVVSKTAAISGTNGVSFAFTDADLVKSDPSVSVMKDSAKAALINLKTGKISYVDGSFESLK